MPGLRKHHTPAASHGRIPVSPYDAPRVELGFGNTWQSPCAGPHERMAKVSIWYFLSNDLIFARPRLPVHGAHCMTSAARPLPAMVFCPWRKQVGYGPARSPQLTFLRDLLVFYTCSTHWHRPSAAPLEAGHPSLPGSPVQLNIWSPLKEKQVRKGIELLHQASSLSSKPISTAASIQLQFQLDLYLPRALHNPQRHQVVKKSNCTYRDAVEFAKDG